LSRSARRRPPAQEIVDAPQRLGDRRARRGVGKAEITLAKDAEIGAADRRCARLLEQRRGERLRPPAGRRNVGEDVKAPFGVVARAPGGAFKPSTTIFRRASNSAPPRRRAARF
jgi:hypothetical protein